MAIRLQTTITPVETNLILQVPENYLEKKLEVLLFDTDEVRVNNKLALKPSSLRGRSSKDNAEKMQQHVQQSHNEWNFRRIVMY